MNHLQIGSTAENQGAVFDEYKAVVKTRKKRAKEPAEFKPPSGSSKIYQKDYF